MIVRLCFLGLCVFFALPTLGSSNSPLLKDWTVEYCVDSAQGHSAATDRVGQVFIDLLRDIAQKEGVGLRVKQPSGEGVAALNSGGVTILAGLPYSRELENRVRFTGETVLSTWGQIAVRAESDLSGLQDLNKKTVGVVKGDLYGEHLRDLLAGMNVSCTFVEFVDYDETLGALKEGWIDAALADRLYVLQSGRLPLIRLLHVVLAPQELRFATAMDDAGQLAGTLDYHLRMMKNDPGSEYHRLINDAFGEVDDREALRRLRQGIGVSLALLLGSAGVMLLLRRQIRVRTAELHNKNLALEKAIESRRRAQMALEQSEKGYRVFLQNFQGIAFRGTTDFVPKFLHGSVAVITGYSENELMERGQSLRQLVHPDDLEQFDIQRDWLATIPSHSADFQFRIVDKGGNEKHLHALLRNTCNHAGKPDSILGSFYDISDDLIREEMMRQAQKMEAVGQLAGGVAHDFNNLLMVIQGCSEFLKEKLGSGTALCEDVETILSSAKRGTDLTRQLLTFSRRQLVCPRELSLGDTVLGLKKMLNRLVGEDVNMVFEVNGGMWKIKADPGHMEQVVANLVVNARDAMPSGGSLKVSLEKVSVGRDAVCCVTTGTCVPPGEYMRLSVADTGIGMDKETLEHIFEPFFTTKEQGKGTGLGLANVYGIVEQHNGHIQVSSRLGEGTVFYVYLPALEVEERREVPPGVCLEELQGGQETILLVEDEYMVRKITARLLERLGYVVLQAENGEEALELVRSRGSDIDLMLTDVILPGMDGKQLADMVASEFPHVKIVYCSGYTADRIAQRQLECERIVLLHKPVELDVLATTVRQMLDGSCMRISGAVACS